MQETTLAGVCDPPAYFRILYIPLPSVPKYIVLPDTAIFVADSVGITIDHCTVPRAVSNT